MSLSRRAKFLDIVGETVKLRLGLIFFYGIKYEVSIRLDGIIGKFVGLCGLRVDIIFEFRCISFIRVVDRS